MSSLIHLLLPKDADLQLQSLDVHLDQLVAITLATTSPIAVCPACGQQSTRVQSHYGRTLADLAWGERTVRLSVMVRRFWCVAPACPRRIFAERLPTVTKPYARRTTRLADTQAHIALALGGNAGVRQCARQHVPVSRPTLLRMIRRLPLPALPPPRVVGVDDWAMRKGRTYGSIVVDLERHQPIDVLPDRTAETWAAWLQAHPGIAIICRDRATSYAAGSTAGAPSATQVAHRWHIVEHMRTAIDETLQQAVPCGLNPYIASPTACC